MNLLLIEIMVVVLIVMFIVFKCFTFLLKKIITPLKKKDKSFLSFLYVVIGIGTFIIIAVLAMFIGSLFNDSGIEGGIVGGLMGFVTVWVIFLFLYYDWAFKYKYLGEQRKQYSSLKNVMHPNWRLKEKR